MTAKKSPMPPSVSAPLHALSLSRIPGHQLTPAQQRFEKLLARVDKLKTQLTDLNTLADAHRIAYHQKITPLQEQKNQAARQVAQALDQRLQAKMVQGKPLTKTERATAAEILCILTEILAAQGDAEMAALHDVYSQDTLEEKEQQAAQQMRVAMEDMLGSPLHTQGEEPLKSVEEVIRLGQQRMREAIEAAEAEKAQHTQARAARKPTARQRKAQEEQDDANTTLRKVFRQLASALHPDRETDPTEQARKTDLMSQANAAYQKRDLVALLQIQLRTELTDVASVAQMAEEKIASLSILLKEQAAELSEELSLREYAVCDEFGLDLGCKISAARLRGELTAEAADLQGIVHGLKMDLQSVGNDSQFKAWLKVQRRFL